MYLRFSCREHLELYKKVKKDALDVVVVGPLDGAIKAARRDAHKNALND